MTAFWTVIRLFIFWLTCNRLHYHCFLDSNSYVHILANMQSSTLRLFLDSNSSVHILANMQSSTLRLFLDSNSSVHILANMQSSTLRLFWTVIRLFISFLTCNRLPYDCFLDSNSSVHILSNMQSSTLRLPIGQ